MSDTSPQLIVRLVGLRKNFGSNEVLRGVDLEVTKGEVVVILGPSGSGKSTLLRCVNRLEEPTGGENWFEDVMVNAPKTNINRVREHIGMAVSYTHLTLPTNREV